MIRTTRLPAMAFVVAAVTGVVTSAHAAAAGDRDRPTTATKSVYITGGPTTLSDNHAPIGPRQ
ncbi:hypothetical protein [Streptomyces gobitricini]|uniref:Uncharacterized protein n=1 Tax=Streptomyces gobitricini TaxID=68211 RepID=A0ABN3LE74_9ACTN